MHNNKRVVILMAEDNEHDIIATRRAWKKNNIMNPLHIVNDGEACLDYLHRRGIYADAAKHPFPGLLMLDINMPKLDGMKVLAHIRGEEKLRRLPVVILTTSKDEEDRFRSYELGVNAYIVKPVGFDNFSRAVNTINMFWELVELPKDHF